MAPARKSVEPPAPFSIDRGLPPGRYPLSKVFPGLPKVPAFRSLGRKGDDPSVLVGTKIEVVAQDMWMYVAPRDTPPFNPRRRFQMVISPEDCIVVGHSHLSESPAMIVYLDILHELTHILQRRRGMELWDPKFAYVDRPTELEAYEVAVQEGRRLGVSDAFLRDYLKVEWVSDTEFHRLLDHLGVPAS